MRINRRSASVMNWRNKVKFKLVQYKGGQCELCGYNKPVMSAFDFHHRDPKEKDFTISGKSWNFEKLRAEVDKCQLLCKICHVELHDAAWQAGRIERTVVNRKYRQIQEVVCRCGTSFESKDKRKFCTQTCAKFYSRKVDRPTKEELQQQLWELPTTKIAQIYGVCDNSVAKWAKRYDLAKPPRGYWQKHCAIC